MSLMQIDEPYKLTATVKNWISIQQEGAVVSARI